MAEVNEDSKVTPKEVQQGFQFMVGVAACLIIFVAILGCCSGQLRNKICLGIYGFFALVIMGFMFAYGGITMGIAAVGDDYCTKDRSSMSDQER